MEKIEEKYITLSEATRRLNCSYTTIKKAVADGRIKTAYSRLHNKELICVDDLDNLIVEKE